MKKIFWLLGFLLVLVVDGHAAVDKAQVSQALKKISMPFIENKGQVDKQVAYYAKTLTGTIFVTNKGQLVYSLATKQGSVALREILVGANIKNVKGEKRALTKINYFKGKNRKKWINNLATYNYVNLGEIWKGINLKVHAYGNNTEKLFYIKPGAKAENIKIKIKGAKKLEATKDGRLKVITEKGNVYFTKPLAYQEINGKRKQVKVSYIVKGKEYAFKLGKYELTKPVIIDPLLASTYLGGSTYDYANAIALDSSGNVYVAGYTNSTDFPITYGVPQHGYGTRDAFVSKLSGDLSQLLSSRCLGGNTWDEAKAITLDSSGNVYVAGYTGSSDFPTTNGAYKENGGGDAFISKLDANLSCDTSDISNIDYLFVRDGARVFWQGNGNIGYYSYKVYTDGNLTQNGTTEQSFINIPYQQDCSVTVNIYACNYNYNPQCGIPHSITFNMSADSFTESVLSNPTNTISYFEANDTSQDDYLNKNISKEPAQVAEPVDVSTGNFDYSNTDMTIPAPGTPFVVQRNYNSIYYKKGWYFSFNNRLDVSDTSSIKVYWGDSGKGGINTFIKAAKGNYVARYGADKLYIENGNYVILKPSGLRYIFDADGKQIAIKNKQGLGIQFEYPDAGTIIVKDMFNNILSTITLSNSQVTSITDPAGNTVSYAYNADGNIESFTDRNGKTTTYQYDFNGYLTKVVGPDGNAYVENTYDDKGRVLRQKDGSGHITTFSYTFNQTNSDVIDAATVTYPNGVVINYDTSLGFVTKKAVGNISAGFGYDVNNKINSVTDANNKKWQFERNDSGLITKAIDSAGNEYNYSYDNNDNLISIQDPEGHTVRFEYDANNNITKTIYPDGTYTTIEYNNNLPVKITDAAGNITQYAYNQRGFVSSITFPNGGKIEYTYDEIGNIATITNQVGSTTTYTYDKNGRLVKITDALGHEKTFEYNGYGDLIKVTDPKGRTIQMEYNVDGLLTKIILPDGRTFEKKYDALGRVIENKDELGRVTRFSYNTVGNLSKVIDPKGNEFSFIYDKVGNLIKVVDAKGNEVQTDYDELYRPNKFYDANGNLISGVIYNNISLPKEIRDASGKDLKFNYDSMYRLASTVLSGEITTGAVYDALGRVVKVIDPNGSQVIYEYDSMGNLIKETNPLGFETTYEYDKANRLTQLTTPDGIVHKYSYDLLNRPTKIRIDYGNYSYESNSIYDEVGNLLSISDDLGSIVYTYDINNRVTSRRDVLGNTVGYEYDTAGRISKLIYPNGKFVTYEYDENNNLIKLTDVNSKITTFEYDANNLLTKINFPTGATTEYLYDNNNRLYAVANYNSSGSLLTYAKITRDTTGKITDIEKHDMIKPDYSKIPTLEFSYNDFNQITSTNEGNFTYTNSGDLVNFPLLGENNTFSYDLRENVDSATILGDSFEYWYDAENNRIAVKKNGNVAIYIIDNILGLSKPIAKLDNNYNIREYYIYGPSGLLYSTDDNDNIKIYFYDYKGNTNLVIDKNDRVLAKYTYSTYGVTLGKYEEFENPFRFLGKYGVMTDNDAQIYTRARYYNPYFARWNKPDIIRGQITSPLSLNRYSYNMGDAVNYVDVSGNVPESIKNFVAGLGHSFMETNTVIMEYKYTKVVNVTYWMTRLSDIIVSRHSNTWNSTMEFGHDTASKISKYGDSNSIAYNVGEFIAPTVFDIAGGIIIKASKGAKTVRVLKRADSINSAKLGSKLDKWFEKTNWYYYRNPSDFPIDSGVKFGPTKYTIIIPPKTGMFFSSVVTEYRKKDLYIGKVIGYALISLSRYLNSLHISETNKRKEDNKQHEQYNYSPCTIPRM